MSDYPEPPCRVCGAEVRIRYISGAPTIVEPDRDVHARRVCTDPACESNTLHGADRSPLEV